MRGSTGVRCPDRQDTDSACRERQLRDRGETGGTGTLLGSDKNHLLDTNLLSSPANPCSRIESEKCCHRQRRSRATTAAGIPKVPPSTGVDGGRHGR